METLCIWAFLINAVVWAGKGYATASALSGVAAAICVLAKIIKEKSLAEINKNRMW